MASGSGRLETKNLYKGYFALILSWARTCKFLANFISAVMNHVNILCYCEYSEIHLPLVEERLNVNNQCVLPFDIELCNMTTQIRRHRWSWNISPSVLITRLWIASAYGIDNQEVWIRRRKKPCFFLPMFFLSTKIFPCAKINFWFFWRIKSISVIRWKRISMKGKVVYM